MTTVKYELDYSGYNDPARPPYFPEHMRGGLERYVHDGILPGSFLTAVLTNNLSGAIMKADTINQANLHGIVSFIYNRIPHDAWGSPERVIEWQKSIRDLA